MADRVSAAARADGFLGVLAACTAAPLLLVRYLPFTDLPEHVAAMATIAQLLPGGGGAPTYEVALDKSQYLVYHLGGGLLTRVVGDAVLANRLLLTLVAITWPFAVRSLLRALGRDERLALLSPSLFWNRALIVGFLPFVASVPLAIYALSTLVRYVRAPTLRSGAWLSAIAFLLFYTHVSSFVLFALAGGVMTLVVAWSRRDLALAPKTLGFLLPALAAAFFWWRAGSLAARPGDEHHVVRLAGHVGANAVPLWAFDIWRTHLDEVWSVSWWTAVLTLAVLGLRRDKAATPLETSGLRAGAFAAVPLICAVAVYVATPFKVGAAGYLDVRLAPMLALLFLLVLRPSSHRLSHFAFVLAAVGALGTAGTAAYEIKRVEREVAGDLDGLLGAMRPNTSVALLNFEQRSPRMYFFPYVFAGSYHRLSPGGVSAYGFADMDHWSIHYRPGAEPPPHSGLWTYTPCVFEYRNDGDFYDYVLVQGPLSPFERNHPGPDFREIARTGHFILFEKSDPELAPWTEDRSICSEPFESSDFEN